MDELDQLLALSEGVDFVGDDDDDLEDMLADIVSGSDLIAGDTEFVGARGRRNVAALMRNAKKRQALVRALKTARAAKVEREGVRTVRAFGDRARRLLAGGNVTLTTSAGVLTIRTQEDIRPDRLILTAVQRQAVGGPVAILPEGILVQDIKHGTRSQFSTNSPISAVLLTRDFFANGGDLGLDTIQAGTDLSISLNIIYPAVTIDPANPVDVQASVQGRAMR